MLSTFAHPIQRRFDFARRAPTTRGAWVRRDEAIMGTAIHVELWADERRDGEAAAQAVMDEMHRIDRVMSPHKPASELSRINRDAARGAVPMSAEMAALIERALAFSALSDGAFDISYAAVGQHYDYRAGTRPDAATLARARANVGWRMLHLERAADGTRTLRFEREGMRIDLGGFAKGHAVDNAALALARRGIRHAYISAGGDSRVIGDRYDGNSHRPWSVAIRDPRRAGGVVAVLPLRDVSVSTSGDYERFFDDTTGGVNERVHHLIDPATGTSARAVHSVTVLADAGAGSGLVTEALSKAVFVLGAERGLALLARVPGTDAVIVDAHGRLHASPGLLNATDATRDAQAAA